MGKLLKNELKQSTRQARIKVYNTITNKGKENNVGEIVRAIKKRT